MRQFLFAALLCSLNTSVVAAENSKGSPFQFAFEELAPGVWAGVRPDGPRFPVMGSTLFVISEEGVVVFDGGGMPAMTEQLIDKVRSLTEQPITHVVTSHWHGDHNFGVFRIAEEYDNVQFIAHEFTQQVMNSSRINYIDREMGFVEENYENFIQIIETGKDANGTVHNEMDRAAYKDIVDNRDAIDHDFLRAKVTPPNITFSDTYIIESGSRKIELLHLGHANTEGDIVMWLPEEKIVATGDIVVLPSPYAFNVPPRAWSQTLRNINALGYETLVPGHGEIQRNTDYVDLLIEMSDSIAAQRDQMLSEGKTPDEVQEALDFSAFEERFTGGDEYVRAYYFAFFETPFRAAALKAVSGERMVEPPPPEAVPFDDERWQIEAEEFEIVEYLGQIALKIKGGGAILPEIDIKNALVEFDVAITPERGFAGLMFRYRDAGNYENFYVRPHQSGNPDANQYQPATNGSTSWQLYHGDGYSAPVVYKYDEWMHVKVLYAESQALVYIDSTEPVLHVTDLKRDIASGSIGFSAANFSAVHFANFRYSQLANQYALPMVHDKTESAAGIIEQWQVSDEFDSALLTGADLPKSLRNERSWTELPAEKTGITNLAEVASIAAGDTVFARHVVNSDKAGSKLLKLGYSDKASVYLNGTLIYSGDNTYQTRDYRYLGTIGLFDSVVLPLKKGRNELWIAVTEAFGGWGVMGSVGDLE